MTTEYPNKISRINVLCTVHGHVTDITNSKTGVEPANVFIHSYGPSRDHVIVEVEGAQKYVTVEGNLLIQAIKNAMNSGGNLNHE